jgi:hypothetical protein
MATSFWSLAGVSAWRWDSTAGKWWLKHCATAVTADLLENGFTTRATRALVTKLLANVVAALQHSPTLTSADMLGLETIINWARSRCKRTLLLFVLLTLDCLPLT